MEKKETVESALFSLYAPHSFVFPCSFVSSLPLLSFFFCCCCCQPSSPPVVAPSNRTAAQGGKARARSAREKTVAGKEGPSDKEKQIEKERATKRRGFERIFAPPLHLVCDAL